MKMQLLSMLVVSLFLILPLRAEDPPTHPEKGSTTAHPASTQGGAHDNANAADVCQMPDGSLVPKENLRISPKKSKEYFTSYPSTSTGGGSGDGEGGGGGDVKGSGEGLDAPQFAMCKECHGKSRSEISSVSAAIKRVESTGEDKMPPDGSSLSEDDKKAILAMKADLTI